MGGGVIESASVYGSRIMIRPQEPATPADLVREDLRQYFRVMPGERALAPILGEPTRQWTVDERPFVEYETIRGRFRMGLESSRSMGSEALSWRLHLWPAVTDPLLILEPALWSCIQEEVALHDAVDVDLLGAPRRIPKLSVRFREGRVERLSWLNLVRQAE